ncbi:helicase-associated domain-containing protein [Mycobacterium shigaense]|uniref:helicase-associated domain-containing protein n=1 Tax=Mycobacterium shigaense TaxID=722731 RepID=UPI002ADFEF5B|nr:helicase-associated domain-containing protein [Mycobacterium shigaense]MEA1120616.1 helicase-associated domain-containing protein [Mycobacterium shigaense]
MTDNTPDIPLGSWLADLPDERLIRLLELRPDLAQPPPGNIAALAARAQARQSVKAATDELDFLRLAVLDALLVLQADTAPVPTTKLLALIDDRAPQSDVLDALDDLGQRALVWGGVAARVAPDAGTALPWHPGQVTIEDSSRTGAQIAELIDGLAQPQRDVLDKLLEGSPVGRTRDAAPGAPADRPVPHLLALGLLRRLDAETVILPRHVSQVLRGEQPGPMTLTAPDPIVSTTTPKDADAAAAGAVIDLLREVDVLLEILGAAPVPELRSGGMGVREVKRLAKVIGLDEPRLGLVLEVTAAAGLIASGIPDPEPDSGPNTDGPYWAPTVAADRFTTLSAAERWLLLATTWLDLPGRPSLIGSRGPDGKPYGALSDSLYSTAAPLDRRLLMGMLAELPPGAGVDATTASAALIWRRPRWARRLQPEPLADLLAEGHALGLIGRGAISTAGRAVLDDTGDPSAAVDAMSRALPKPIDHFLMQADLTVVVPGPLQRELAEELATVATVESAGAAMVYRISEQSIRHALDIGKTRDWMHAFFVNHSKTPVPQGLTYLIDDVARRHGQLRIGVAASFVRCEDPALLAQAVAAAEDLQLRALAPTVAVSPAPIADVLGALRSAGFAPAAEDASGAIVDVRPLGARVATPQQRRPYRPTPRPSSDTLNAVVSVLRKVTAAPFGNNRVDPAVTMSLLQRAARDQETLLIGYLDPAGVATQRMVSPITIKGGQLVAFDSASARLRDFAIHRITSVVSAHER